MLSGTNRASDRFARPSYYIATIPKFEDERQSVRAVLSMSRNVSVPLGFRDPEKPNIATTIWRAISDHKSLNTILNQQFHPIYFG